MFLNQITLIEGIQKFVFAYAMFKICFFLRWQRVSWQLGNAFTIPESSGVEDEAFTVHLLNGSIHFRLWSPGLQKTVINQKSQDCKSPYSTCSDGTWHRLSFSHSPLRVCHS